MASVFIVAYGTDCEGSEIIGVFANEKDAVKCIDKRCENSDYWIRKSPTEARSSYVHEGRQREGCHSVYAEEWDVE